MKNEYLSVVEVKRATEAAFVKSELSADGAVGVVLEADGESDVTIIVTAWKLIHGQIMIAVSGQNYFLSMVDTSDQIYQFVAQGKAGFPGEDEFIINGERTSIESRYVVDSRTAALVVRKWIESGFVLDVSEGWEEM